MVNSSTISSLLPSAKLNGRPTGKLGDADCMGDDWVRERQSRRCRSGRAGHVSVEDIDFELGVEGSPASRGLLRAHAELDADNVATNQVAASFFCGVGAAIARGCGRSGLSMGRQQVQAN